MDVDITIECLVHHMTTSEPVPGRAVKQRNGHPRWAGRAACSNNDLGGDCTLDVWVCSIVIHGWMQCTQWISTSHDGERT